MADATDHEGGEEGGVRVEGRSVAPRRKDVDFNEVEGELEDLRTISFS